MIFGVISIWIKLPISQKQNMSYWSHEIKENVRRTLLDLLNLWGKKMGGGVRTQVRLDWRIQIMDYWKLWSHKAKCMSFTKGQCNLYLVSPHWRRLRCDEWISGNQMKVEQIKSSKLNGGWVLGSVKEDVNANASFSQTLLVYCAFSCPKHQTLSLFKSKSIYKYHLFSLHWLIILCRLLIDFLFFISVCMNSFWMLSFFKFCFETIKITCMLDN